MLGSIIRTPAATKDANSVSHGGGLQGAPSASGIHAIIDDIRNDLKEQRKMLEDLYVKVGPLESHIRSLNEDFESLKSDCVRYGQLAELDAKLRLEMAEVDTKQLSGLSAQAINRAVHDSINAAFLKGSVQQASAVDSLRQELFSTTLEAIREELKHELIVVHDAIRRGTPEANRLVDQGVNSYAPNLSKTLPHGQFAIRFFRMHGETLGLNFRESDDGKTLEITKLDDNGLVPMWNIANPNKAVNVGDHLVSLNGVRENAKFLEDRLRGIGEMNATFLSAGQKPRAKSIIHHF